MPLVLFAFVLGGACAVAWRLWREHSRPAAAGTAATSRKILRHKIDLACRLGPATFWELDLKTGAVYYDRSHTPQQSQRFATRDEWLSAIVPQDLPRVEPILRGVPMDTPVEYRLASTDGEAHWMRTITHRIGGTRLVGLDVDVSERVMARSTLGGQRAQLKIIFDSSPAMIWYKDRQNHVLRINTQAAAGLGRPVAELEGRSTEDLYPAEAAAYYQDDLEVINSGQSKLGIVEPLTLSNGEQRWMRTDKVPYRDEQGEIAGVIVFAIDITDQKHAELRTQEALVASERANRAKSDILSNVSHEIRTPLGVIMGFSELLLSQGLPDKTRVTYAEKILRNGRRLMKLIDEILDLAKIEQGRFSIEPLEFSLGSLLADVSSLLSQKARAKGLEFSIKSEGAIPATIVSDPSRLRQVLTNVIDNAIKFTDKGLVDVVVRAPKDADGQRTIEVLVRDTGLGMPREAVERLFQPFSQADLTTSRRFGGSGLGLSLSKRLAQALGGDVTLVETTPGLGSVFKIWITPAPVVEADLTTFSYQTSAVEAPETPAGIEAGDLVGLRVLLVEDNPDIQDMIRMYLETSGIGIEMASNGQEGIDQVLHRQPDLVLMDLQLPGIDGMRATAQLRQCGFKRPIIAMTAHAMKGQRQLCLDAGFDDFLTKPLSKDDLLRKIQLNLAAARRPAEVGAESPA